MVEELNYKSLEYCSLKIFIVILFLKKVHEFLDQIDSLCVDHGPEEKEEKCEQQEQEAYGAKA